MLKFKAYNIVDGQFYDVYAILFCEGGTRVEGTGVSIANGWAHTEKNNPAPIEVMLLQYSGYNDINGTPIFDGDILDVKVNPEENKLMTVEFSKGVFRANGYFLAEAYHHARIVGHIFKDPEP